MPVPAVSCTLLHNMSTKAIIPPTTTFPSSPTATSSTLYTTPPPLITPRPPPAPPIPPPRSPSSLSQSPPSPSPPTQSIMATLRAVSPPPSFPLSFCFLAAPSVPLLPLTSPPRLHPLLHPSQGRRRRFLRHRLALRLAWAVTAQYIRPRNAVGSRREARIRIQAPRRRQEDEKEMGGRLG